MDFESAVLSFLASTALRSAALATLALVGLRLARVKSASAQHAVWAATTGGMLLLAALTAVLPGVPVRVLGARA